MAQSNDLVAASATQMVLVILHRGERYGCAIVQEIRDVSEQRIEWKDGMVYPLLRRLESQGLVESSWRIADSGRRRRYCRLNQVGIEALARHREQWQMTNRVLTTLWEPTLCAS
jgi:PadR family transcriptional regulator, regulatory protein PadR